MLLPFEGSLFFKTHGILNSYALFICTNRMNIRKEMPRNPDTQCCVGFLIALNQPGGSEGSPAQDLALIFSIFSLKEFLMVI